MVWIRVPRVVRNTAWLKAIRAITRKASAIQWE